MASQILFGLNSVKSADTAKGVRASRQKRTPRRASPPRRCDVSLTFELEGLGHRGALPFLLGARPHHLRIDRAHGAGEIEPIALRIARRILDIRAVAVAGLEDLVATILELLEDRGLLLVVVEGEAPVV